MGASESFKRWKRILWDLKKNEKRFHLIHSNFNNLVREKYPDLVADNTYKRQFASHEYSLYSQNGEDGLILHILNAVGSRYHRFIEFGIGDGKECNGANLVLNLGWDGLMIDGNSEGLRQAKKFYSSKHSANNVNLTEAFITKDNINDLFKEAGFTGEIDFLSIDIDGNDYWVWQAIEVVNPRVISIEYNASFGKDRAITIEYQSDFTRFSKHRSGWYYGASLLALEKLGMEKGYVLVGCESHGVNAFFVREDLLKEPLQRISALDAYYEDQKRLRKMSTEDQFALVSHLPTVEV